MEKIKAEPEDFTYETAVQAALENRPEGFDWLYRTTYAEGFHLAMQFLKNEDEAFDILHDSYIKAWENLSKLRKPEKFQAWFNAIVINASKDVYKRKTVFYMDEMFYETEEGFPYPFEPESQDEFCQPELILEKALQRQSFMEWLKNLPHEQYICMKMHYIDGMKTKEIAEKLGCPDATVRSRLMYGRKKLLHIPLPED